MANLCRVVFLFFNLCSIAFLLFQAMNRHRKAFEKRECDNQLIMSVGQYYWRNGGEKHMNDPLSIANLQVHVKTPVL